LSPLYALRHQSRPPLFVVDFRITPPRARRTLRPTNRNIGPFEVTEVRSDIDYKLALPPALRIHDVFHVDRLSPYKGNEVNGQVPPPPEPVTVEGEEEYEVDHIRDSKLFGRTLKYLVRWTGYGEGVTVGRP
jgi:hypothetical protein